MASASDHCAHAALQPADCLILLPQRLPAAVETSIGPAHYPAECTQSDAFLQPSLRARNGRANSDSFGLLGLVTKRGGDRPVDSDDLRFDPSSHSTKKMLSHEGVKRQPFVLSTKEP